MNYYYEQSAKNIYEKNRGGFHFFEYRIVRRYEDKIQFLTKGFKYINFVINKYLESPYFNETQKDKLKTFKNKIILQSIITKAKSKLFENITKEI